VPVTPGPTGGPTAPTGGRVDAVADGMTLDTSGAIGEQVVSGAKWSTVSKLTVQGLQFLVGLLLARLLLPEQFGLVASVYVITQFSQLLFELGLGASLIQLKNPTERDMSTVFWVNVISGVVFAAVLSAAAPLIAAFYGEPLLTSLTPVVALAFTVSIGVVHNAILARRLRFRTSAGIEIAAAVGGHTTTVVCALAGLGAFSLAFGGLATSLLGSVLVIAVVRWRPRHFISRASVRRLWRFSGGMLGFNVVNYWGRNADNLLVGRFLGAGPLGLYSRAYNLMLLPINQVTQSLGRVMFPALAALQGDLARTRRAYLRTVRLTNVLTVPILVGLLAVAEGAVPLLWGPNWAGTVPLLQVLCIAGLPQCLSASVGWIYQSQGRTTRMFVLGVVGTVVGVAGIVIGLHWGAIGVAWGVAARYWLMMPVGLHVAGRLIDLKARVVLGRAAPILALSLVMGAVVWGVPRLVGLSPEHVGTVAGQVVVGGLIYLVGIRVALPAAWEDMMSVVRRRSRGGSR
jgi:O-antigen/teichoic acid export membrane protein